MASLDVTQSLIVGVSLAVTALERRAGDIEALRIAFDDNRQRVVLHADIVLREATPGVHRIPLGWTGRRVKNASWAVSYQGVALQLAEKVGVALDFGWRSGSPLR